MRIKNFARWLALAGLAAGLVAAIDLIPRYKYHTWEFPGSRLVNYTNTSSGFDIPLNSTDIEYLYNFRWTREARLVKRNGWSINDETIGVNSVKFIGSYPFYYATSGAVALRVMAATADTDNKLYFRCLLAPSCPVGVQNAYENVNSTTASFATEKRASGDTWSFTQLNNQLIVARGSEHAVTNNFLWAYDPGYQTDGATALDWIHAVGHFGGSGVGAAWVITSETEASGGTLNNAYFYAGAYETNWGTIGPNAFGDANATGTNGWRCSQPATQKVTLALTNWGHANNTQGLSYIRVYRATGSTTSCTTAVPVTDFCYIGRVVITTASADDTGTAFGGTDYVVPDGDCLRQPYWSRVTIPCPFKYIAAWHSRLWGAASTDGATRGCSRGVVYFSDIAESSAWTDINYRYIGKERGEKITCLHPYKNMLYVGTDKGSYAVIGDSADNYVALPISNTVGCTSHWAVVEADGTLYWHYLDSVYSFDGATLKDVGAIVRGLLTYTTTKLDTFAAFAVANVPDREIWFYLNQNNATYPDTIMVYNYAVDRWWQFDDSYLALGVAAPQWTSAFAQVNSSPQGYYSTAVSGENKLITFETGYKDGVGIAARATSAGLSYSAQILSAWLGNGMEQLRAYNFFVGYRDPTDCSASYDSGVVLYSQDRSGASVTKAQDTVTIPAASNGELTVGRGRASTEPAAFLNFILTAASDCDIQPTFITLGYSKVRLDE